MKSISIQTRACLLLILLYLCFGANSSILVAAEESSGEKMIELNLPREVEIGMLTDYVSVRLNMNILYSESVARKKVTIHSPAPIPFSSLDGLYRNILKMSGLVLVEADQAGWWQIVADRELLSIAGSLQNQNADGDQPSTAVMTRIFRVTNIDTSGAEKAVKPLLSKPGGTIQTPGGSLLIVTDYADNIQKIAALLELADSPGSLPAILFVPVKHLSPDELANRLTEIWHKRLESAGPDGKRRTLQPTIMADTRGKRLVIIAAQSVEREILDLVAAFDTPVEMVTRGYSFDHTSPERVDRISRELITADGGNAFKTMIDPASGKLFVIACPEIHHRLEELIKELDTPTDIITRTYRLKHIQPRRIESLAKSSLGNLSARKDEKSYSSVIDDKSGLLIITAAQKVHDRIGELINELDNPEDVSVSPIRFYKLYNTVASEVMATIQSITSGENNLAALLGEEESLAASSSDSKDKSRSKGSAKSLMSNLAMGSGKPADGNPATPQTARQVINSEDATISADENTNSIIVVAPPSVQSVYKRLIDMLDKRRPQVMVEVILVTVDTSSGQSLGVEVYYGNTDDADNRKTYTFSAFGLSTVDMNSGLTLQPGTGFNGTLIDSDMFSAVVRAVANDGNSRVLAAPRILAYDNGTATLSSVVESPYTSVNASDTVATTSFGGYASAGATVTVTPHISEGDYLQLKYTVTLNSFTGEGAGGVPPPRQTNTIDSEVMIPDGHAVIVGGLTRKDFSESAAKIPWLGDIPLLGHLFRSDSESDSESTLFVFIRPVILRDDLFEDLKRMSVDSLKQAELSLPETMANEATAANSTVKIGRIMLIE